MARLWPRSVENASQLFAHGLDHCYFGTKIGVHAEPLLEMEPGPRGVWFCPSNLNLRDGARSPGDAATGFPTGVYGLTDLILAADHNSSLPAGAGAPGAGRGGFGAGAGFVDTSEPFAAIPHGQAGIAAGNGEAAGAASR